MIYMQNENVENTLKLTSYPKCLKSGQYYYDIVLQNFDNLAEYDLKKIALFILDHFQCREKLHCIPYYILVMY